MRGGFDPTGWVKELAVCIGGDKEEGHNRVSYVNKHIVLLSLFLWCIWCVEFEKDDVSILNGVVSSLLSVFPSCL